MDKLWDVFFNDGGWHTSLPHFMVVAKTKEEAIAKSREKHYYPPDRWGAYASELKIEGYEITVKEVSKDE